MPYHLRQFCLVAPELEPSIVPLAEVLGAPRAYVDPGVATFGLENTLLGIGTDFLEVVAPVREGTAAGRFLARRGGAGGYMVIVQATTEADYAAAIARAEAAGVRIAFQIDRPGWSLRQLHPADMGAAFLEFEWDPIADVRGNWHAAGGEAWRANAGDPRMGFTGGTLQGDDPAALAARWGDMLGSAPTRDGDAYTVAMANAVLRFVAPGDERGPGLTGIALRVPDRRAVLKRAREHGCPVEGHAFDLGGVRFTLHAA